MPCLKNIKCESVIIKIKKRQKGFGFSGYKKKDGFNVVYFFSIRIIDL